MAFGLLDIAKIGIPLAANIVAPGIGGIAASGLMGAGEAAIKGKRMSEILKSGAIGAGTGALGAEAGKAVGGLLSKPQFLQAGSPETLAKMATGVAGEGAGAKVMTDAATAATDAAKKVRFMEQMQSLGDAGSDFLQQNEDAKRLAAAARTQANFSRMSGAPQVQQYGLQPWVPRY
ncbi:MAG: hypothetical protein ACYTFQ_19730 [Planctomycetota bacterium]|jgi:hypothetical protein